MTRGTGAIIDYSALYDGVVRTTLWKEVRLVFAMFNSVRRPTFYSVIPIIPHICVYLSEQL